MNDSLLYIYYLQRRDIEVDNMLQKVKLSGRGGAVNTCRMRAPQSGSSMARGSKFDITQEA